MRPLISSGSTNFNFCCMTFMTTWANERGSLCAGCKCDQKKLAFAPVLLSWSPPKLRIFSQTEQKCIQKDSSFTCPPVTDSVRLAFRWTPSLSNHNSLYSPLYTDTCSSWQVSGIQPTPTSIATSTTGAWSPSYLSSSKSFFRSVKSPPQTASTSVEVLEVRWRWSAGRLSEWRHLFSPDGFPQ